MLNARATRVHAANQKWWHDLTTGEPIDRNTDEMLMLVVSELAEAMEGHRKSLMDDKLPHRRMAEVEVADALIRLLDIAGAYEFDLEADYMANPIPWGDNFAENLMKVVRVLAYDSVYHQDPEGLRRIVTSAIFALIALSEHEGFDLDGAFEEKMLFNTTRHDHTREGRLAPGGKQY